MLKTHLSADLLAWERDNDSYIFVNQAIKHQKSALASYQTSNKLYAGPYGGMENYFSQIKSYFGQTKYDQMIKGFMRASSLYMDTIKLAEWHPPVGGHGIYGNSRVGIYEANLHLASRSVRVESGTETQVNSTTVAYQSYTYFTTERGAKRFELTNHLGNVLAVITDKKVAICSTEVFAFWKAELVSATDYSPFGAPLAGRTYQASEYRFGFNGQERDDEVAGFGNIMTAEFWEYDARLGRRWNLDPVVYAWQSGYVCFNNSPIFFYDYYGLEGESGDKTTGPAGDKEDGGSDLSYLNTQNNSNQKDNPSWLKKLVDFVTTKHNGPPGKWVKDNPKTWTELPGTFNPSNNTYGYSAPANTSDRIISYKIEIEYPNYQKNFSSFKLDASIPGSYQKKATLYSGVYLPFSPDITNGNKTYNSGLGDRISNVGGTLLILSSFSIISLDSRISSAIIMIGAFVGHRINPIYRDYNNFQISINSNQRMAEDDIRMFVRYKRYVPYSQLTDEQKGFLNIWYYGF